VGPNLNRIGILLCNCPQAPHNLCINRLNPTNANDAILVWGDVAGCVNAINFSSATIALFERPAAPAGGKQGMYFTEECSALI